MNQRDRIGMYAAVGFIVLAAWGLRDLIGAFA